jgi:hypothetical protein
MAELKRLMTIKSVKYDHKYDHKYDLKENQLLGKESKSRHLPIRGEDPGSFVLRGWMALIAIEQPRIQHVLILYHI